jgi:hypothetical protein
MNLNPAITSSLLLGGVLLSGCAATPAAIHDDAVHTAASIDHHGCSTSGSLPFSPNEAERADPLLTYGHRGRSDGEARLRGAELRVRVQPGMTAEWLEHEIACHAAKTALGQARARTDDPFFLPDGWVDTSVRSEAGTFLVTLRPRDPERAKEVLGRAEAFVARR